MISAKSLVGIGVYVDPVSSTVVQLNGGRRNLNTVKEEENTECNIQEGNEHEQAVSG